MNSARYAEVFNETKSMGSLNSPLRTADSDGNTVTIPDANFESLFPTPAHPEYPSGHSTISSAATRVLAHFFGNRTSFDMTSDVVLGVVRSFSSFSDALHEVTNARVFAGIHFRTACEDGEVTGKSGSRLYPRQCGSA